MTRTAPTDRPGFGAALRLWLMIGLQSFGGPAAQISLLHQEVVERRGWVQERDFLAALNFCMLLPGPEAQQLATWIGLRLHGVRGALAAGGLFILPGALVMFLLAWLAAAAGDVPVVRAALDGVVPIVVALVLAAVWRLGRRTLTTTAGVLLAAAAFLALTFAHLGFVWIVAAALLLGAAGSRFGVRFGAAHGEAPAAEGPFRLRAALGRAAACGAVYAVLLLVPWLLLAGAPGPYRDVLGFFSQAAWVTFGGAYAVLPYVADQAVGTYGWLSETQMVHGLALAETTPGPLILVTEYVGFFAGWNAAAPGANALLAGALAAALTLWATFLPSFLFIVGGAPFIGRLSADPRAQGALAAVTAAVVGVIATLAVRIAPHAFRPEGRLDPIAILVALAALAAAVRWRVGPLWLVAAGAAVGLLRLGAGL
jgi:chromate transporter